MTTLPAFAAGRIVAASWPAEGDAPAAPADWTTTQGAGWFLAAEPNAYLAEDERYAIAVTTALMLDRRGERLRDVTGLLALLGQRGASFADDLGAPFRVIWVDKSSGTIAAACDRVGLGHLFTTTAAGAAWYASSASLLAERTGAEPSRDGLAAFAQFGAFPHRTTPYVGVDKLLGGTRLTAQAGVATLADEAPVAAAGPVQDQFAAAVGAMLRAAPEAALELSGGLDSRVVLAAIPPAERTGRLATTLGERSGTSGDQRIATRLAAATGLDHRIIAPSLDDVVDAAADLPHLLDRVIDGYDCMANPLDKLGLVLARNDGSDAPRFGGQNGETLRGFYYPMQSLDAPTSSALVERLTDWRLIANDRVDPQLFSATGGAAALAAARAAMIAWLAGFPGRWGNVLDRIYLDYRMQAWAGNASSNRFVDRAILWPFFDTAFLAAAAAVPPARKRDSRAAYDLLVALDPALAAVPLDNGLVPAALSRGGLRARLAEWRAIARKTARKAMQRLRPRPATVMGTDRVIDRWHAAAGYERLDVAALSALELFDERALGRIATGVVKPDRATLGFLLLCNRVVSR